MAFDRFFMFSECLRSTGSFWNYQAEAAFSTDGTAILAYTSSSADTAHRHAGCLLVLCTYQLTDAPTDSKSITSVEEGADAVAEDVPCERHVLFTVSLVLDWMNSCTPNCELDVGSVIHARVIGEDGARVLQLDGFRLDRSDTPMKPDWGTEPPMIEQGLAPLYNCWRQAIAKQHAFDFLGAVEDCSFVLVRGFQYRWSRDVLLSRAHCRFLLGDLDGASNDLLDAQRLCKGMQIDGGKRMCWYSEDFVEWLHTAIGSQKTEGAIQYVMLVGTQWPSAAGYTFSCTNLTGEELAVVELPSGKDEPQELVALGEALSEKLNVRLSCLRIFGPDGKMFEAVPGTTKCSSGEDHFTLSITHAKRNTTISALVLGHGVDANISAMARQRISAFQLSVTEQNELREKIKDTKDARQKFLLEQELRRFNAPEYAVSPVVEADVQAGVQLLVRKKCSVFESVSSSVVIDGLLLGHFVTPLGPPILANGRLMVKIEPAKGAAKKGAVEMSELCLKGTRLHGPVEFTPC